MGIKTISLSRLEAELRATLNECADSGQAVVVEMPDQRLIAIQALEAGEDDSLVDELLESNSAFQAIVAKSKASPRMLYRPGAERCFPSLIDESRRYPDPKWRELSDLEKEQLRQRIEGGEGDIYRLSKEFDCSSSQAAGIKATMSR